MTSFSPETSPPNSTADRLRSKEAHKSPASRSECSTVGWPKVGSKPGPSPGKATHAPSATSTKLLSSNSHVRTNPGSRNLSVNTYDRFGSGYAMKLGTIIKPVQEAVVPIWILISKITFEGPEPQNTVPPGTGYGVEFLDHLRREPSAAVPAQFDRSHCIQRNIRHPSRVPLCNTALWSAQDFSTFTERLTCNLSLERRAI